MDIKDLKALDLGTVRQMHSFVDANVPYSGAKVKLLASLERELNTGDRALNDLEYDALIACIWVLTN